jgi:chaperonin GroES
MKKKEENVAKKKAVKKATKPKAIKKAPKKTQEKNPSSFKNFLTPLDDRLLVQISDMERKTAGGLFIPDTVADTSGNLEGVVVAAGRGHRDQKGRVHPMDVKVGDKVIFSQYTGNKIELEGQNIVILREAEVMGIVSK